MRTTNRRLMILAALAAGALALAACDRGAKPGAVNAADMSLGDPAAKIKMVEYASPTCPHCARFSTDVFPAFKAKYIDTGKVHYTFKEFLTPPNDVAAASFLLARCAGKDKYFTVLDTIFRSQQEMFGGAETPRDVLLRIAQSSGMSEQQFTACVGDEASLKALNERVDKAIKVDKINSTPTFLIDGKKIKEGEISLTELDAAVAAAGK
ncbi:MAG: DsbA family protein [Phenylobacterium sp.]|uniref:DsbA family protein n=1 Tax=Phenylobacterium sp. TaxID=1871053 RepID=UPI002733797D|nr:DsbA family protein [Phenylobacterium sp.]MDP3175257.1 DsbA family protein [Phenylobacterium sp.]